MKRVATETNEQQATTMMKKQTKDQFVIQTVLGTGTFGKVYLAEWRQKQKLVALKHVFQNKRYKNRELEIIKSVRHPAIVQLFHFFYEQKEDGTYLNLAMEYVPQTLSRVIKNKNNGKEFLSNESVIKCSFYILSALQYLAKKNISHRDIKPSNILVTHDYQAKLCDFGSAKILIHGQKNLAYICSRFYRAPQLILGAVDYTTQVDIWSLGCVLTQMLINTTLFEGSNNMNQLLKIIKVIGSPSESDFEAMKVQKADTSLNVNGLGIQNKIRKVNPNVDPQLLDLIKQMLVYDPKKRITPTKALSLSIFQKFNPLTLNNKQGA